MNKISLAAAASLAVLLAACGQDAPAPAAQQAPAPAPVAQAPAAPAPAVNAVGESVYKKTCALCHAAGVAGAPKLKDKADWEPRLAQGMETVYDHAINGFTGEKGMMPARGGGASLTDDEVTAAVDYMVSTVQ